MKLQLLTFASMFVLTACDQLDSQSFDATPNPSPEQEQMAQMAYDHLRHAEFDLLIENFSPELKAKFQQNGKELKKFAQDLPKENYKSKKIVAKHIDQEAPSEGRYTVSYEYAYPKNLVQYDVSFAQVGSHKIRDINIQIFGE